MLLASGLESVGRYPKGRGKEALLNGIWVWAYPPSHVDPREGGAGRGWELCDRCLPSAPAPWSIKGQQSFNLSQLLFSARRGSFSSTPPSSVLFLALEDSAAFIKVHILIGACLSSCVLRCLCNRARLSYPRFSALCRAAAPVAARFSR